MILMIVMISLMKFLLIRYKFSVKKTWTIITKVDVFKGYMDTINIHEANLIDALYYSRS